MDICAPTELTLPFYGINFWVTSVQSNTNGSSGMYPFSCFMIGEVTDN